jgi:bifunctional DNA-binding transcriptional regulator/antitoxin component of YhaV-PrlF toxin-antitoxin module
VCINNPNFVDNAASASEPAPEPELESVPLVDCASVTSPKSCRQTLGTNGGADACLYNTNRKRCVNNQNFVDNATPESEPESEPESLADCAGKTLAKPCRKTLGPNGGEGACLYNTNKKKCVNNKNFVDNAPSTSEPAPESLLLADCTSETLPKPCRKTLGPNGGADACLYNTNKKKCVNNPNFVDIAKRRQRTVGVRGREIHV